MSYLDTPTIIKMKVKISLKLFFLFQELMEDLKERLAKGEEVDLNLLFNSTALNVLWRLLTGKTIDRKDPVAVRIII